MKILALVKYGERAASTRQRLLQFKTYLGDRGIDFTYSPLLGDDYVRTLATSEKFSWLRIAGSYLRRAWMLISFRNYDVLWIHYELFPYLGGFAERLAFVAGKPVVYDFDDATFHQYNHHTSPLVRHLLARKLEPLLRQVSACSCGNAYLKAYAVQYCSRSTIIPTVVDTTVFVPKLHSQPSSGKVVIGWIGSPTTWTYVVSLVPVLRQLVDEMDVVIRIVGAGANAAGIAEFEFVEWSEETEVSELQKMDIGIMPLPDEPWARGKCGYKLIQYMACGLPVVASPVGVNTEIVIHGENGFLATNDEEWRDSLVRLSTDPELCRAMGAAGRAKIEAEFSLKVHAPRLVELLNLVSG